MIMKDCQDTSYVLSSSVPTVCFNNKTIENGLRLEHFICPTKNDTDDLVYCCGAVSAQTCCSKTKYESEKKTEKEKQLNDLDIV